MTSPPSNNAITMAEQIAITETGPDTYTSTALPQRMGNALPIAYGGCTASIAVHSACKTVLPSFHLYSVLGAFHGPTRTDRPITCTITRTRDTKTFATRRVVASQVLDNGTIRTCLDCFVDFHTAEPSLVTFSTPPLGPYDPTSDPLSPTLTSTTTEIVDSQLSRGLIDPHAAETHKSLFRMAETLYESRPHLAGITAQNSMGLVKSLQTTQDHLPTHAKTSAEWIRVPNALSSEAEHMAALAFIMDGALSFLPLNHEHMNFGDAGACSTLDFALRVLVRDLDMGEWMLRERMAIGGGEGTGRHLSEGRLWDRRGRLVATESQSSILRPPVTAGVGAKAKI